MLDRMASAAAQDVEVISWGSPVPVFGDLAAARVATLGLNPSNREFVDEGGAALVGAERRFHTLDSLSLKAWEDANSRHIEQVLDACVSYFLGNPYDRWFRRLDTVVAATGSSFYDQSMPACHLDLIPFATARKWTDLSHRQRAGLLSLSGDLLGQILQRSRLRVLILNGQTVVDTFQQATGVTLARTEMSEWALPRKSGSDVAGFAFQGTVECVAGYPLAEEVLVLGFNHNLQSSYGVTTKVIAAIRAWVGEMSKSAGLKTTSEVS